LQLESRRVFPYNLSKSCILFVSKIRSLLNRGFQASFRFFSTTRSPLKNLKLDQPSNSPTMARDEEDQLITTLYNLSKKSPKLVKSSAYCAPADPQIVVHSWKMNEFKYYDIPSPFPTLARGLFTVELPIGKGKADDVKMYAGQQYRIVARGYDKFFNIGEVPWCTVRCQSCLQFQP
jgi:RNA ligase